jgi:ABC-type tungstate transport system permease subunit/ABC-type Fe3+-hydroxamate transport system substrate-binding protein
VAVEPTTAAEPTAEPAAPTEELEAEDAPEPSDALILATTTSTENSGLLDHILPDYEAESGVRIDVVAVGTGQALKLGEDGNADVLMVHARAREDAFMDAGHGVRREDLMYNEFVVVGPPDDPAGIAGMTDAAGALKLVAAAQAPFVSRGDDSGTHTKEKAIWAAADVEPSGGWYVSAGQGMGAVLTMANEQMAYTLSDRATYLARTLEGIDLEILVEGDPILFNPYGVIAINPDKGDHIKIDLANDFIDWLISLPVQEKIGGFGVDEFGAPLFTPDSAPWREVNPPATAETGPIVVTDACGREVTLDAPPQRIVVPGKATWMVSHALYMFPDVSGRIVAMEQRGRSVSDFVPLLDPTFLDKPHLEKDAAPEQIAPLKPDAILLKSFQYEKLGVPLEGLGFPVVCIDLETPQAFYADIETMGQVLGNEARATEIVDYYDAQLMMTKSALAGMDDEDRPDVLVIQYESGGDDIAFEVPPVGYLQTWMVETAGGNPVWLDAAEGGGWTTVNFEQIAAWDADKIFVIAFRGDAGALVEQLETDPQWEALRAVQDGEFYGFPADLYGWDVPDPRWILGQTWLASKIHPDRFAVLDIVQATRDFFEQMYGMDQAAVDEQIIPELKGSIP